MRKRIEAKIVDNKPTPGAVLYLEMQFRIWKLRDDSFCPHALSSEYTRINISRCVDAFATQSAPRNPHQANPRPSLAQLAH